MLNVAVRNREELPYCVTFGDFKYYFIFLRSLDLEDSHSGSKF